MDAAASRHRGGSRGGDGADGGVSLRRGATDRGAAPGDWDWKARCWLALVALLAAPALVSPLVLLRLPDAFPTSLIGLLSLFVEVSRYAIGWAALAALAAGVATYQAGLSRRVLAVLWAVVVVAALVAVTTAGRRAAYRI